MKTPSKKGNAESVYQKRAAPSRVVLPDIITKRQGLEKYVLIKVLFLRLPQHE